MEEANGGSVVGCRAVLVLLCSLAPGLMCYSLQQANKPFHPVKGSAGVKTGTIWFNGAPLEYPFPGTHGHPSPGHHGHLSPGHLSPGHPSPGHHGHLFHGHPFLGHQHVKTDYNQMDVKGSGDEAAWRRLNTSLQCGQNWMKLKAIGPGATQLQLDTGSTTLPLGLVPTSCGYSMQQNPLGLVLVVPYDACSVIQENGQYVLPTVWNQTPVKLACPITSTPATPASSVTHQSLLHLYPKGDAKLPPYDPTSPYYPYWYAYYLNMLDLAKNPSTPPKEPAVQAPSHYPYYNYYTGSHYPYYITKPVDAEPSKYPTYIQYPQTPVQVPDVENPDVHYHQPTDYYYGKYPNFPWSTPEPSTTTTSRPCYASSSTTTAKPPCRTTTKPPKRCYGRKCPFVPFAKEPFNPVVSYRALKAPDVDKYMPEPSFKIGSHAQTQSPSSVSWHNLPWFPQPLGQNQGPFDWGHLQEKQM